MLNDDKIYLFTSSNEIEFSVKFDVFFLHNFSRRSWGGEEVPKKEKGGNEKGGEEKERMEEEEEKERGTVRLN